MNKLNLCVIFGGRSPEHDISLKSVTSVLGNLDKNKYNISVVGITKCGKWYLYTGGYDKIIDGSWENETDCLRRAVISPDASDHGLLVFEKDAVHTVKIDVVFPVMHGESGEDGTIQGLLEIADIPYVGMGVTASANGMDKTFTKLVFEHAGIPQAKWVVVTSADFENLGGKISEIEKKLGYPCFVKPACTGSSVGVSKAADAAQLESALKSAAEFGKRILVEEYIDGHEVECAVLGNDKPQTTVVGEIIPTAEFYDFEAKYVSGTTELQIPAKLPDDVSDSIRSYAARAFCSLGGRGLSRVDFFVRYSDGEVILNEINTMPGFTDISMYPKLWGYMGLEYGALLDRLIKLAQER